MTSARPGSGRDELVLGGDPLLAVFLPELGGRLHRLRAYGVDLLRTPDDPDEHRTAPFFWGAYPMAPWCNRAAAGRQRIAGREVELAANFEDGTAIHGLVSSRPWAVRGPTTLAVEVDEPGWPWPFRVSLAARIDAATVWLHYRLVNAGESPMPAGLGLHPWFRGPLEVRVPAGAVYPSNTGSAPEPEQVAGPLDLRRRAAPAPNLDATWDALAEPLVELAWPDRGLAGRLEFRAGGVQPLVALASPSTLGAVAIEPQTHGPDPLRRLEQGEPGRPILLPPGAALSLEVRLEIALARDLR